MNSCCVHDGKEICDEEEETDFFHKTKKGDITKVASAHEDEKFVQKKNSQADEKESKIIAEIKYVTEDPADVEILDFVRVDKFFEEKNQVMKLIEINCGVDKLIKNCGIVKVDAVVSVKKLK